MSLRLGDTAPDFEQDSSEGRIDFHQWLGNSWGILFSHPADFTPVCTTEFMTFASMQDEFKTLNAELLGLSIDSTYSHIAWLRTIREKIEYKGMKDVEVNFPVISDLTMEVANKFGMVQPGESNTQAPAKAIRTGFMPAGRTPLEPFAPESSAFSGTLRPPAGAPFPWTDQAHRQAIQGFVGAPAICARAQ